MSRFPVTVQRIRQARGYSGRDHELEDTPLFAMIGRTYGTLQAITAEANRIRETRGWSRVSGLTRPPLRVEVLYADGTEEDVRLG